MRRIKPLEDVTLEDVLRLKGSRWKQKMIDAKIDMTKFLGALSMFLNDVPEFRKLRAFVILGTANEPINIEGDYTDYLYDKYGSLHESLDTLSVTSSATIDVGDTLTDDMGIIEVENTLLTDLKDTMVSHMRQADSSNSAGHGRMRDAQAKFNRASIEAKKAFDIKEQIKDIPATRKVNVVEKVNSFISGLAELDMYPLNLTVSRDGRIHSSVFIKPRLMYDINTSTRSPKMTQPMVIKLSSSNGMQYLRDKEVYSIRRQNNYGAFHPHIGEYICWGDLSEPYNEACRTDDIIGIFKQVDKLLRAYNSGSPFVTWSGYDKIGYNSLITSLDSAKSQQINSFVSAVYDDMSRLNKVGIIVFAPVNLTIEHIVGEELYSALSRKNYHFHISINSHLVKLVDRLEKGNDIQIILSNNDVYSHCREHVINTIPFVINRDELETLGQLDDNSKEEPTLGNATKLFDTTVAMIHKRTYTVTDESHGTILIKGDNDGQEKT